jgi:uncharacterized FlaG/YvyC family protein
MEIQATVKAPVQTGPQSSQQAGNGSAAESGTAAKTVQINPANVVTVTPEAANEPTDRRQDKLGKPQEEVVSAQQVIDSLRLTNRRTQLEFNTELNTVFVEIVDTRTDEVVETIPPEELVRQLQASVEPAPPPGTEPPSGAVVDQSI